MLQPGVATQLLFSLFALSFGVLADMPVFSTASAEEKSPPPIDLMGEAAQLAGYLLILIVLAALAVHLGRRFQPGSGKGGPIHIVDGRNLAPGVGVRLVRVGSQSWLIGVTKERVSLLAEIAVEDLTAEGLASSTAPGGIRKTKPMAWTGVGNHEPKV